MNEAAAKSTSDDKSLGEWLSEGPYALAMSSGFFGFFAHTGFLSVLEDRKTLPVRFAGSSAGALVSGLFASGLSTDVLAKELTALRREHFWDAAPGFGLLRGQLFLDRVESLLDARTFDACRFPVSVSVLHVRSFQTRVISAGRLAPALCASCAVPGLFHPVRVEDAHYWDGGVRDRPGILGLKPHEDAGGRVLFHHLESRSPWRTRDSLESQIPNRKNVVTVVLANLPRSGPFKLDAGRRAMDVAREKMRRALATKIKNGIARVE